MEATAPQLKVAPTAAIVLHFARPLYESGLTHAWCNAIDLSDTEALATRIREQFPHLPHTVLYRKRFIRHLLHEHLADAGPIQVCILGAGLDPLALWLLEQYPGAVSGIFEVDRAFTPLKRRLYPAGEHIHFIQADINDTLHLPALFRDAGYHPDIPAVIVFEGLIHYITDTTFLNVMQYFRTANKTNVVMLDYLLPEEELPGVVRPEYRRFRTVLEGVIEGPLQCYSRQQLFALVSVLQGDVVSVDSMQEVEYKLNGRNEHFYGEGEGFIEMISCYI